MNILACLVFEHDWRLVFLAVCVCLLGSYVTVTLMRRSLTAEKDTRMHWTLLAAVAGGAAIWTTHFVAMLGYKSPVPVSFDGALTVVSAIVAIIGLALSIFAANLSSRRAAIIVGGGMIGLTIAAMHYVGMFAYRVEGVVTWIPEYIVGSIISSTLLGMGLVAALRSERWAHKILAPTAVLVAAIVALHFTGMTGFSVVPLPGFDGRVDPEIWSTMASAITFVTLLILGAGVSTHQLERRTYARSQDELAHIAMHDSLTELANRHSFTEALKAECAALSDDGEPVVTYGDRDAVNTGAFALLMVDLDRFKPINDMLGHPAGDVVLQKVARRLRCAVRKNDLVARVGGDEFAVILRNIQQVSEVEAIAERIIEVLARPFLIGGNVAEIGGSVGIALAPEHGLDAQELVQQADVALYASKRSGSREHCLFQPELLNDMQHRRQLEADLRRAVARGDFSVHYQPVLNAKSGKVSGAEALLRWTCDKRGPVSPAEFIPVAEDLGLVSRIGADVLRQACRDASMWPEDLHVSVNISPVQLLDPRLPQTVKQALDDAGLAPERLELEITETALLGNDQVAFRSLSRLSELGVSISLDDFGTGYSSLSYLHRFPINRIKIDRSFVQRLPEDPGSASIVRAIAQLGASLDLRITAEGIETVEQFNFITEHGCDTIQGFLISEPLPMDGMCELIGVAGDRRVA